MRVDVLPWKALAERRRFHTRRDAVEYDVPFIHREHPGPTEPQGQPQRIRSRFPPATHQAFRGWIIIQRTLLVLAAAAGLAIPVDAAAQARSGPSVEASLGLSARGGGEYRHRPGPALDAMMTVPVRARFARGMVAGLAGSIIGLPEGQVGCVTGVPVGGPLPDCRSNYPQLLSLGLLGGVQRGVGGGASARVLAGPAYYRARDGDDTFGMQGRVDVAAPLVGRLAVVASLRGSLLPRLEREMLHVATGGLGLRIQ